MYVHVMFEIHGYNKYTSKHQLFGIALSRGNIKVPGERVCDAD